jgi:hypothetical protein
MTVQDVAIEMEELAGHIMDVCSVEGGETDSHSPLVLHGDPIEERACCLFIEARKKGNGCP